MAINLWDDAQHLGECTLADELAYQALPEETRRICARVAEAAAAGGTYQRAYDEGYAAGREAFHAARHEERRKAYEEGVAEGRRRVLAEQQNVPMLPLKPRPAAGEGGGR